MKLGASLVLANGFDGMFLSDGFTLEGNGGRLAAGSLTLPRGRVLDLPPLKLGDSLITVTAALGSGSSTAAALQAQWEGSSQPAQQYPLTADGARTLRFRISADGLSLLVPAGRRGKDPRAAQAPAEGAGLLLKIGNPADAALRARSSIPFSRQKTGNKAPVRLRAAGGARRLPAPLPDHLLQQRISLAPLVVDLHAHVELHRIGEDLVQLLLGFLHDRPDAVSRPAPPRCPSATPARRR